MLRTPRSRRTSTDREKPHTEKLVAEIMAAWRRAEQLTATLPKDSPEHGAAQTACRRLRDTYQELRHSGVASAHTAAEARMLLADASSDIEG